jgi:hypothetical protein
MYSRFLFFEIVVMGKKACFDILYLEPDGICTSWHFVVIVEHVSECGLTENLEEPEGGHHSDSIVWKDWSRVP